MPKFEQAEERAFVRIAEALPVVAGVRAQEGRA